MRRGPYDGEYAGTSMKNAPLAAMLCALLTVAGGARADEPSGVSITPAPVAISVGSDGTASVSLKNGNLYRGELVERIQGDHITLKLATGELKTFAWDELAPAPPPPGIPPAPAPRPVIQAPPPDPGTLVTLNGDGVRLERLTGTASVSMAWGSGGWGSGSAELYEVVCMAPCNKQVDPSAQYRLAGPGLVATGTFPISGSTAHIDAHMGSRAQRTGGWVIFGVGLAVGAMGFLIGAAVGTEPTTLSGGTQVGGGGTPYLIAGGIGVAAAIGGLVMVVTAASSAVVNGESVGLRLAPHVALTPRGLVF